MKSALAILTLTACAQLPHREPAPRNERDRAALVVRVISECRLVNMFDIGADIGDAGEGMGVLLSDKHVLTAGHVVACPTIPFVRIELANGKRYRVDVERDAVTFEGARPGEDGDLARLVIATDETFGLAVVPPVIATPAPGDTLCVYAFKQRPACGSAFPVAHALEQPTPLGTSGAPVFDVELGALVGEDVASDHATNTRYAPLDVSWLKGT